jgi:hypothetical protein
MIIRSLTSCPAWLKAQCHQFVQKQFSDIDSANWPTNLVRARWNCACILEHLLHAFVAVRHSQPLSQADWSVVLHRDLRHSGMDVKCDLSRFVVCVALQKVTLLIWPAYGPSTLCGGSYVSRLWISYGLGMGKDQMYECQGCLSHVTITKMIESIAEITI